MFPELNEVQREAVHTTEGFVRVIAGAGSGKTRAISSRFAFLVNELGILPAHILCVTFTNKAANEMRQRIRQLTGDNDAGYISTFHAFCSAVLAEDSHAVQYPASFLTLDNADIDDMLRVIYEERGFSMRDMTFQRARDMIEIQKLSRKPDYYKDLLGMSPQTLRERYLAADNIDDIIFYGYLYQEKKCFGLDYNDLIIVVLHIFREHADIRLKWQQRLEYIMVDEFQDIDKLQYELMQQLCAYHHNLMVVGDPDQTIYSWRGADIRFLLHFDQNFPGTRTIYMMENYRSTPQILRVATDLISHNTLSSHKALLPIRPDGAPVHCYHADTAAAEATWIAQQITQLRDAAVPLHHIAILYRAHYVSRNIEDALRKAAVPYVIYSGTPFYARMEIKDTLSYLRMIAYKDDLSFRRVVNTPKRNVGKRRLQFLQEYVEQHGGTLYEALCQNLEDGIFRGTQAQAFVQMVERLHSGFAERTISELLSDVLDRSGYEKMLRTEGSQERLDNLAELRQSILEYETSCGEESTLVHYLEHIALFTSTDTAERAQCVKLMTIHAAKGLEFPYVFLCGLNEGILPSRRTKTWHSMEEERRLAFVAMTRAEECLYLSEAEGTSQDQSDRYPSRFLMDDIDPALLQFDRPIPETLMRRARAHIHAISQHLQDTDADHTLSPGTRVRHSIFGTGSVIRTDQVQQAHLIQFDDMPTPRAISFRARLERLT